jgi:hypothetical protein
MYEWVVAVVIDFDHKFIYSLNYFEQTNQYTTKMYKIYLSLILVDDSLSRSNN